MNFCLAGQLSPETCRPELTVQHSHHGNEPESGQEYVGNSGLGMLLNSRLSYARRGRIVIFQGIMSRWQLDFRSPTGLKFQLRDKS